MGEHSDLFLQKLVTVVDRSISNTGGLSHDHQNLFYTDPVFHVSLLSCSGDVKEELEQKFDCSQAIGKEDKCIETFVNEICVNFGDQKV